MARTGMILGKKYMTAVTYEIQTNFIKGEKV